MRNINIKDIASKNIISLTEEKTLFEAVNTLTSNRIHNIIITSSDGTYSTLSIDNILAYTQDDLLKDEWKSILISSIPRKELNTISEEASSLEASILLKDRSDVLGVMSNDKLVGVVSYSNIRNATELDMDEIADMSMLSIVSKNSAETVDKDDIFSSKIKELKRSQTDCIIVVDNNQPIGIITKRDFIRFLTEDIDIDVPVHTLMSTPIFLVHGNISIYSTLILMQEKHYRRVIVVDEFKNILGVVTQKAIINIIYTRMVRLDCLSQSKLNNLLETEVKKRTKELEEHHQKLEEIIKERTKELEEANKKLNEMYVDEYTRSKQKNTIMFQQSKQAIMGELLSMIAHQWRQPLTSISYIYTMLKIKLTKEPLDKNIFEKKLDEINKHIQYMSSTIEDFKDFYKEDKQKEEFTLQNAIESSLEILATAINKNKINIINKFEELPKINSYKNEIIQVLLNIIKNSIDMVEEKGTEHPTITISTNFTKDKKQEIHIKDNNKGIPESIVNKIFDPYFTTKDEKNGTGLGLYIAKMIIEERCNAKIAVKNHTDGVEFIITL